MIDCVILMSVLSARSWGTELRSLLHNGLMRLHYNGTGGVGELNSERYCIMACRGSITTERGSHMYF